MRLKTLKLKQFRGYGDLTLECHPHLNILIGDNAQGKTSILEAIHTLGLTKSHRTYKDWDMVQIGHEYTGISALFDLNDKEVELRVVVSKTGKKAKYNQIEMDRLSDYIGYLTIVMFAPEDLDLVKGGPMIRRRFLDLQIGQLSKPYLNHHNHYRRLLRERNEILKGLSQAQKFDGTLLDVVTDQLCHYAEKIIEARQTYIRALNETVRKSLPLLSEDDPALTLRYEPSIERGFKEQFKRKKSLDIATGSTQIGPHRDDFGFYFNEKPVKSYASQGQIRTIVLMLKLAVVKLIFQHKKQYPIILLDDVFSELDHKRQTNLLKHLTPEAQIFITTTDINTIPIKQLEQYTVIQIENGAVKGVEAHGSSNV